MIEESPINSPTSTGDAKTSLLELKNLVQSFVDERQWQHFHNLKNLSMALSIEAAELMEHTQWLTTEQVESATVLEVNSIAEELADVFAYALAIANVLKIDLATALRDKMVKNRAKYPVDSPQTVHGLPTRPVSTSGQSLLNHDRQARLHSQGSISQSK